MGTTDQEVSLGALTAGKYLSFFSLLSLDFWNITPSCEHIQFSSIGQCWPTLCHPMDCSTPGLPVHHQLPEFTQTHVHWVGDAIQPSHPLSILEILRLFFSWSFSPSTLPPKVLWTAPLSVLPREQQEMTQWSCSDQRRQADDYSKIEENKIP